VSEGRDDSSMYHADAGTCELLLAQPGVGVGVDKDTAAKPV
jgi:hypothetical protein